MQNLWFIFSLSKDLKLRTLKQWSIILQKKNNNSQPFNSPVNFFYLISKKKNLE